MYSGFGKCQDALPKEIHDTLIVNKP